MGSEQSRMKTKGYGGGGGVTKSEYTLPRTLRRESELYNRGCKASYTRVRRLGSSLLLSDLGKFCGFNSFESHLPTEGKTNWTELVKCGYVRWLGYCRVRDEETNKQPLAIKNAPDDIRPRHPFLRSTGSGSRTVLMA